MADKLSESTWTSFTRKQKLELEDGPLLKALARFDKTDEAKPEPRHAALEELVDQIKKQVVAQAKRKKELGDKPFGELKDKLYELLDLAEKTLKETEAALAKARQAEEAEGDEDSPALLTGKMLPLLREVRKGEATLHAMICTAGKNTAVLVMRRAIGPGQRMMLAEAVDAKGGAKYIAADCVYEKNALTFIVQSPAGGLAKRVRQALLDQTGLRLKVVVRGEDGEEHDGVEEAEGAPGTEGAPGDAPTPTPTPTQARNPPEPPPLPSAEALAYTQRWRRLEERVLQALQAQHPESTKLRAVSGFAGEKAEAHDYAGAGKALDMLEKLLAAPSAGSTATSSGGVDSGLAFKARLTALVPRLKEAQAAGAAGAAGAKARLGEAVLLSNQHEYARADALLDEVEALLEARGAVDGPASQGQGGEEEAGTEAEDEAQDEGDTDAGIASFDPHAPPPSPGPSLVALGKARLEWETARRKVRAELQRMQRVILEAIQGEPDAQQVTAASEDLFDVLDVLDESLIDILDDWLIAEDGAQRYALRRQAVAKLDEYSAYLSSDELVLSLDDNPFTKVQVRSTLEAAVATLRTRLA